MAFLDFRTAHYEGLVLAAPRNAASTPDRQVGEPAFSPLERHVISLSRTDGRHSLATDGIVARLRSWVTGRKVAPLADPRLESLRRLGVLLRVKGFGVRPSEIDRFIAAGFSSDHVDALHSAVTA